MTPTTTIEPQSLLYAIVTYKGHTVAEMIGTAPKQLEQDAHHYASNNNYHRAVVQIPPA